MSLKNNRLEYLDFAKGLAVIFMIVQHIGIWMWKLPWSKVMANFSDHIIYVSLNTLSGLSAPIFIFSAGTGAFLLMKKYDDNQKIIKRGLFLLLLGYIHNLTITHWFTYGSWYVLHLMGFGFLLVPILKKLKSSYIVSIILIAVFCTYTIQTLIDTPLLLKNKNMSDVSQSWAMVRLAFVEGHFPILPWISFFFIGFLYGRLREREGYVKRSFLIGSSLLVFGGGLILVGHFLPDLNDSMLFARLFFIKGRFYPMVLPMLLLLSGLTFIVINLLYLICSVTRIGEYNPIVLIGRFSLTIFFTHVYLKFLIYELEKNQTYTKFETMSAITIALIVFTGLSYAAQKTNYKFSLEGLLRRLS